MHLADPEKGLGAETYTDSDMADFFDRLEFDGTYELAVRDLPGIIEKHVIGRSALDFACGCGRSTRHLKSLGFSAIGADVSPAMLKNARRRDPRGVYHLVGDGELDALDGHHFDLILSAFPMSSMTSLTGIAGILAGLRPFLSKRGRMILIEANHLLYRHEWVSFTPAAFPQNAEADSGDPVPIHFRGFPEKAVVDTLWKDEDYRQSFAAAGLVCLDVQRPLVDEEDPRPWMSERDIPPWVIYVLADAAGTRHP